MGLGVTLITFVPATLIKSADVNSNFATLNSATAFNGGVATMNFEAGKVTSDGSGNIHLANGQIGATLAGDILDASGATDLYLKASSASGSISFLVNSILTMTINTTGLVMNQGGIVFTAGTTTTSTTSTRGKRTSTTTSTAAGSLSRTSQFSGTVTGTYNHGNNGIPNICYSHCSTSNFSGNSFDSPTRTTVHIFVENSPFICYCLGF